MEKKGRRGAKDLNRREFLKYTGMTVEAMGASRCLP